MKAVLAIMIAVGLGFISGFVIGLCLKNMFRMLSSDEANNDR